MKKKKGENIRLIVSEKIVNDKNLEKSNSINRKTYRGKYL